MYSIKLRNVRMTRRICWKLLNKSVMSLIFSFNNSNLAKSGNFVPGIRTPFWVHGMVFQMTSFSKIIVGIFCGLSPRSVERWYRIRQILRWANHDRTAIPGGIGAYHGSGIYISCYDISGFCNAPNTRWSRRRTSHAVIWRTIYSF